MATIPAGTKFIGIGASVPTPENKSSQNNGFQEVYTIEDLQESVGGSEYTETIVEVSASQLFNSTTSSVVLLPSVNNDQYIEYQKIVFEYEAGDEGFDFDGENWIIKISSSGGVLFLLSANCVCTTENKYAVWYPSINTFIDGQNYFVLRELSLFDKLFLYSTTDGNLTQGNGTLRVKIYHKTVTFGA